MLVKEATGIGISLQVCGKRLSVSFKKGGNSLQLRQLKMHGNWGIAQPVFTGQKLCVCVCVCVSKNTSKLRVTGLYEGNSPVNGEFSAQKVSNAESVSIWWCHHDHKRKWIRSLKSIYLSAIYYVSTHFKYIASQPQTPTCIKMSHISCTAHAMSHISCTAHAMSHISFTAHVLNVSLLSTPPKQYFIIRHPMALSVWN